MSRPDVTMPHPPHPPRDRWFVEMWDGAMWMLASRFHTDRSAAEADLAAKTANPRRWAADGEPVLFRLLCERTAYTVLGEGEQR